MNLSKEVHYSWVGNRRTIGEYSQAQPKPKLSQAGLSLALFPAFRATRPAGRQAGQVDSANLGS